MLGNFHVCFFLLSTDFISTTFFKKLFQGYHQSVKHSVSLYLGPNCLQRLSAGHKSLSLLARKELKQKVSTLVEDHFMADLMRF